ncbi:unnamed protein product [Arabidopsis halleri]
MRLFLLLCFRAFMLLEAYSFTDETDRQALLAFKSQISEDKIDVLSSWNHSFPLCNWKGVTCGRKHKRVTDLDLGGLQLGGVISPSIEYGMGGQPSIYGDVYSFGVLLLEMFTGKRPTNELFGGNFTLHSYAKSGLPERVMDIADNSILHSGLRVGFPIVECLTSILEVGLRCSEEYPANRLAMSGAAKELISIRERFFKTRRTARR